MRAPLETPEWLREQTRQQQAAAPYCGLGFKVERLDPAVYQRMSHELLGGLDRFRPEAPIDEISTEAPDFVPALVCENRTFNAEMSELLRPLHEAWSGMALTESACYGFRAYQRGSYLLNHVDRTETHIISSTVCVDASLDEPWPLYVEDVLGEVHQINLEPGELLLYEGARLVHGRPWPLVGDYYVGLFVHYRPKP
jgi:prolyl 4-hydroxylase